MVSVLVPVHPGEILRDAYLAPLEISAGTLQIAERPAHSNRAAGDATDQRDDRHGARLANYFKTSPEFWINLQSSYDLKTQALALHDELEQMPEYVPAG